MRFNEPNIEQYSSEEILKCKAKKCLKCGEETNEDDVREFFCSHCGAPVLNRCSDYECQKILEPTAKFCKYCGNPSIFNNFGLLDKKPPILPTADDLPF